MNHSIHPATRLGPVSLTVSDLSRSLAFYQERLGFQVHEQSAGQAALGAGGEDLVLLTEQPGAQHPGRTTGLYHFAILVPSRVELAQVLRRIAETRTPVQGFSDHLVSEAIYLADPDGSGIEIYRDRPREQWEKAPDGQLRMATDPLDVEGLLGELTNQPRTWTGLSPETVLGHMHLHVGNIREAEQFYNGILGFDLMLRYGPTASFLSAGGYHHHLGINTWNGVGAPPPPSGSTGMRWFTTILPDEAALAAVTERAAAAGLPLEPSGDGFFVRDPFQNQVYLRT